MKIMEPLAPIPRRQLLTIKNPKWKNSRNAQILVSSISYINIEQATKAMENRIWIFMGDRCRMGTMNLSVNAAVSGETVFSYDMTASIDEHGRIVKHENWEHSW